MKLSNVKISIEMQVMSLESSSVNVEILKAMKQGNEAAKKIRGNIDESVVEDLMDDMQEERDVNDAISNAISRDATSVLDDEELLEELAALEAEEAEASLLSAPAAGARTATATAYPPNVFSLPEVPSSAPRKTPVPASSAASTETEEERAFRELVGSMTA